MFEKCFAQSLAQKELSIIMIKIFSTRTTLAFNENKVLHVKEGSFKSLTLILFTYLFFF